MNSDAKRDLAYIFTEASETPKEGILNSSTVQSELYKMLLEFAANTQFSSGTFARKSAKSWADAIPNLLQRNTGTMIRSLPELEHESVQNWVMIAKSQAKSLTAAEAVNFRLLCLRLC